MKILNVCELLPIKGLKAENDISIKILKEVNKIDSKIEFVFLKSLPFSNNFLSKIKPMWKQYSDYINTKELTLDGYRVIIYPWLRFPTSNFHVDNFLLFFNKRYFLQQVEAIIVDEIMTYDLILSQNNNADGVVANYLSQKYGIPHIHTLRGKTESYIYETPYIKNIIMNAFKLITPSPTMHRLLNNMGTDIQLIPHGVDKEFFFYGSKNYTKPILLVVCRLLPLKNINLVIDSLYQAKLKGLDFELSIIGDGPQRCSLEKKVADYKLESEIQFLGWLDKGDVIKKMHSSNIMVMPSYPETLGRVFLEAAAAKCLCIGHEATGVDGIFNDGIEALFCDKVSLNDKLHNALLNINSDEYNEMIENAFSLVEKLNWESVAKDYIECFYDAVK